MFLSSLSKLEFLQYHFNLCHVGIVNSNSDVFLTTKNSQHRLFIEIENLENNISMDTLLLKHEIRNIVAN